MSHEERTTELIHLAVDGEATELDLKELDDLLAQSAEARMMRDEIENIVRQLNGMPAVEPPHIKDQVLSEISHANTLKVVPFHPRKRLAAVAVWAVAAALVIGFGVQQWVQQHRQVQPGQASASMMRTNFGDWETVANIPSATATLIVRRNGDLFAVQPVLASPVPISIRWDAGRFDLAEAYPTPDMSRDAAEVNFGASKKQPTIVLRRRPDAFGTTEIEFSTAGNDSARATISLD